MRKERQSRKDEHIREHSVSHCEGYDLTLKMLQSHSDFFNGQQQEGAG